MNNGNSSNEEIVTRKDCPSCGSSDALMVYGDGHTHCFSCEHHTNPTMERDAVSPNNNQKEKPASTKPKTTTIGSKLPPLPTQFRGIPDRRISSSTVKFYGVTAINGEKTEHIYPYFTPKGEYCAAKRRAKGKQFSWKGSPGDSGLFGEHLFPAGGSKSITVTEGECDAMAAFQMFGSRWGAVSVKSASTAVKDCRKSFKYLNSFENIVICFDKDEPKINPKNPDKVFYPGQEAAEAVARMFPVGKVRVLTFREFKDAGDYLTKGKEKEFIQEWWNAPKYTPAGIVVAKDMWSSVSSKLDMKSIPYPWDTLNYKTYGIRLSEIVVFTAEEGRGKTTVMKEIQHHILSTDKKAGVGILHIEEPNRDTGLGLMSITANKPLHLPDVYEKVSPEDLKEYFDETLNNERILMWDHFGGNTIDEVINTIRYMKNMGCDYFFLDHLNILVSDHQGDERKLLDEIITRLKTLCMELHISLICVAHQSRSGEIRGTAGIGQLANIVVKLHRDIKSPDDYTRNVTSLVVEKNRFSGRAGPSGYLYYDGDTGRLQELNPEESKKFEEGVTPSEGKEEFKEDWS